MDKNILFLFISLLICSFTFASNERTDLAVSSLAESLTKEANSVVRNHATIFEYISPFKGTEKNLKEITILNEKGLVNAHFSVYGDRFRKLKKFSAIMYDKDGNEMKKIKMSDIKSTEWSSELASDNLLYYFECQTPVFPFSVSYEYEIEWSKGILSFPVFAPQFSSDLSVQKASYALKVPTGTEILFESNSFIGTPEKKTDNCIDIFEWKLTDLMAIADEPFSPGVLELTPVLYTMPKTFTFDGQNGSFATINSIVEFQNKLNDGRDNLPEDLKQKIIDLTKNVNTGKEKVKILYDFLGQTTRYESIQLGIGGFQPATSEEVSKMAFGDCKGLSFYLKSMLETVGIESNYTIIRSDLNTKNLQKNFTGYLRANHVILCVPLANDTLWLECTNTKIPFGYVHKNISGHHAITVAPDGGKFVKLPDYPDKENLSANDVIINFDPDAETHIKVKNTNHLKKYEDVFGLTMLKSNEQIDHIRRSLNLQKASVSQLKIEENSSETPSITFEYDIASNYGTKTGNRYFIPINIFRPQKSGLSKTNRKHDIVISNGWQQVDNIKIILPEGFEIEYLPESVVVDSPFGTIESVVKTESGNTIIVNQRLLMKSGNWGVKTYDDFYNFMNKIASTYKEDIVLRKI